MSHSKRPPVRPSPGPDWAVQDVRAVTDWRDGSEACATCGDAVDLNDDHYGMELFRSLPSDGKLVVERERFVFCADHCVERWRRD